MPGIYLQHFCSIFFTDFLIISADIGNNNPRKIIFKIDFIGIKI